MIDPPSDRRLRAKRRRAAGISCCSLSPRPRCSICVNLLRSRTGRAWRAIHARETVAEALGISIAGYKLLAFVISSAHDLGRGRAVRLLPRFRLGRGVFACSCRSSTSR